MVVSWGRGGECVGVYVQGAEREDAHQSELLLGGDVEALDDGHGQRDDEDVGEDVDGGVGEPQGFEVDAGAGYGPVPEAADGRAAEDAEQDCFQGVEDDEGHGG